MTSKALSVIACLVFICSSVYGQQTPSVTTTNQNPNDQTTPMLLLGDYEVISAESDGNVSKYFKTGDIFFADSADASFVYTYIGMNRVRVGKANIKPYDIKSATPSPTMQVPQGMNETQDGHGGKYYTDSTGKRFFLRQYQPKVEKTSK